MADETESHEIVNCDENGDAILVINRKVDVRVSSRVLSLASTTFRCLFDGRFAEGRHLSSTEPPRIAITEDNTESMVLFCRLLHWNKETPRSLDLDTLFELSLIADERDCCIILRPYAHRVSGWPANLRKQNTTDLLKALNISLLMQEAEAFKKVSNSLCLEMESAVQLIKLFREAKETPKMEQLLRELIALHRFLEQRLSDVILAALSTRSNELIDLNSNRTNDRDGNSNLGQKHRVRRVHRWCTFSGALRSVSEKARSGFKDYPVDRSKMKNLALSVFDRGKDRLREVGLCLDCFCTPGAAMNYGEHSHIDHAVEQRSQQCR